MQSISIMILAFAMTLSSCSSDNFNAGAGISIKAAKKDDGDDAKVKSNPSSMEKIDSSSGEISTMLKGMINKRRETSIYNFEASQIIDDSYQFTLDNVDVATDFTMKKSYQDRQVLKKQITRESTTDMFTQGSDGDFVTDQFDQVKNRGIVDILLVVDNSGSMIEEQKKLADRLQGLLSEIADTNWQIAITSTTANSNCTNTIVMKSDKNFENEFKKAISSLGTNGSGDERGIFQARKGLECFNIRKNSTVAVLIVSDEDNCSTGNCGSNDGNISYLTNYVENTLNRTVGKDAGFYGIFAKSFQQCPTAYNIGNTYSALLEYKKENYSVSAESRFGSICANDYNSALSSISKGIASQVKASFALSRLPDDSAKVKVTVNTPANSMVVDPSKYQISGMTLTFLPGFLPPLGSSISAQYQSGATAKFNKVTLSTFPAPQSVNVSFNGIPISDNLYTIAGKVISFNQTPSQNTKVKVSYKINTALLKSFSINGKLKADSLKVFIDNQEENNYSFLNNTITFDTPPPESSNLKFDYIEDLGPILTYRVAIMGQNPRNFKLSYNNNPISENEFIRNGDTFTIDTNIFQEGAAIDLTYEIDDTEDKTFALPFLPIENTVKIASSMPICTDPNNFEIINEVITTRCIVVDSTEFVVDYQYLDVRTEFIIAGLDSIEKSEIKVFVNGMLTEAYKIEENKIILDQAPPLGVNVSINHSKHL